MKRKSETGSKVTKIDEISIDIPQNLIRNIDTSGASYRAPNTSPIPYAHGEELPPPPEVLGDTSSFLFFGGGES